MVRPKKPTGKPGGISSRMPLPGSASPTVIDNIVPPVDTNEPLSAPPPTIVGIGASAGGLEALKRFFAAVPAGTGLSFVVVMHLDPSRKSMLDEILARTARLNVCHAEDGSAPEPDTVYIAPPRKGIVTRNGLLHLEEPQTPENIYHLIDIFFTSLASELGGRAIALVLSGTGADGSMGARAVKDAGGTVLVQDEASAAFPDMPRSVIAAGAADQVLPVERMPEQIMALACPSFAANELSIRPAELDELLGAIFRIVKARTGHDFSNYKVSTVLRRIERRMAANGLAGMERYRDLLEENPGEAHLLCQDMLIGVTSFFRDPDAFSLIRTQIFPRLFNDRGPDDPVRIWHASCSTGEEVYSMAILVREYLDERKLDCHVQFFATDIDETAIPQARSGIYPRGIEAELGQERLQRFFVMTETDCRVTKELREMIVFAPHSLVKDPPFSRLDLLVCRNLLIYLKSDMQQRLIALFHLALKPGGILFLGSSETVGRSTDLFTPIDANWKIYERQQGERKPDTSLPFGYAHTRLVGTGLLPRTAVEAPLPGDIVGKLLLERYSPPCVVVNDTYEVVYVSTRIHHFLEVPVGAPTRDLMKMAHKELRPILRSAIHKAFDEQKPVVFRGVRCADADGETTVNILVEPLAALSPERRLAMVIFEPTASKTHPAPLLDRDDAGVVRDESAKDRLIRQLEEQLFLSHEQLQATIEQLESANEGLISTNEELLSINEEFQSTNEELHSTNEELETSREELQALNEELVTVNAELQQKVEDLDQANSDMDNLLTSTEIATIFLDRELRIKLFTPAMAELFHLIPSDTGRPFRHLSGKVDWTELANGMESVLAGHKVVEREVSTHGGTRHFLARVLPYRSADTKIDGVVLALIDITERRRLEARTTHLASFPEINPNPVMELDHTGAITYFNPAISRILESLGMDGQNAALFLPGDLDSLLRGWDRTTEETYNREVVIGGRYFAETVHLAPQLDVVRIYAGDITDRKRADFAMRRSEERYRGLFEHLLEGFAFCQMLFEEGKPVDFLYLTVNDAFGTLTGLHDVVGKRVTEVIPGIREADAELFDIFARVALTGEPAKFEKFVAALDMWFAISVYSPERECFVAIFDVITERKKSEASLREQEEIYSAIVNSAADGIVLVDPRTLHFAEFNDAACTGLGYSREEFAAITLQDIHEHEIRDNVAADYQDKDADCCELFIDHRHLHKDGSLRDVQVSGRCVTVRGNSYQLAIWHDITERKQTEEEREKAARLESLGLLAGGIAHDFNNILTAVIGNISLARTKIGEEHSASTQLASCETALDKATYLTRQLLTFSRGGEPVRGPVDTPPLIREVVSFSLLGSSCKETITLAPDLWNLDADAGQIHQALNNMIINAVHAMPNGGVLAISATNEKLDGDNPHDLPAGRYVKLTVADQGCGIPPNILPKIFDPYFTTKPTGTGLGLASVFSIVKRHEGAINVSSIPGEGTTFTVFLPAAGAREPRQQASQDLPELPTAPAAGTSVLVMDDEEMIRSLADAMLDKLGYRTVTCTDGAEAVAIYRRSLEKGTPFSLVILDMTVPGGMGGKEAAEQIKAIDPGAKLVISTGYAVNSAYQGEKDPLFHGAVSKPYNINQLAQELARLKTGSKQA
jgi:two-component system, chemotaxis family, CheB/CheR fusion protein